MGQVKSVNLMLTESMKKYQSLMQHLPNFFLGGVNRATSRLKKEH